MAWEFISAVKDIVELIFIYNLCLLYYGLYRCQGYLIYNCGHLDWMQLKFDMLLANRTSMNKLYY